jgi:thioredoxin 1
MSKFGELINSKTPVLIHYAVDHVPECVEIQHILESVAEEMGNKLTVIKIDILKNKELAEALRIKVAPTLMLYKDGAMVWRHTNTIDRESLVIVAKAFS